MVVLATRKMESLAPRGKIYKRLNQRDNAIESARQGEIAEACV